MGLRARMVLLTLAVVLVPLAASSVIVYTQVRESITQSTDESLDGLSHNQAERLHNLISTQADRAHLTASRTALRTTLAAELENHDDANIQRMTNILGDAQASVEGIVAMQVIGLDGQLLVATSSAPVVNDWTIHPAFLGGQTGTVADIILRDDAQTLRWYAGTPLELDGAILGVLVVTNHVGPLLGLANDYSGLGDTGETVVLERMNNSYRVVSPLRFSPGDGGSLFIEDPNQAEFQAAESQTLVQGTDYRGEEVLAVGRTIEGSNLRLLVKVDESEALATVQSLLIVMATVLFVAAAAAAIATVVVARSISRPIVALAAEARRIGGDTVPRTGDEVAVLVASVEAMAANLLEEGKRLEERVQERTAELEDARYAAEAAGRAKGTFLATMSHEIRTPMNAVIGLTDVLLSTPLSEEQKESLGLIQSSGMHLLQVINQVLDFSKIEAGHFDLHESAASPRDILADAMDIVDPVAAARSTKLEAQVSDDVPAWIRTDAPRLRQVVVNLASNAVKAAPKGNVDVRMTVDDGLVIEVQDNGVGIDEADQKRLFEAFEQAATVTGAREGTGLGLAISRRIIEAFGGTISLESKLGEGSTFRVHLPLETAEAPALEPTIVATGKQRVLVADDSSTNRRVAQLLIQSLGHHVTTVPDGQDVVPALEKGDYDVLLVDLEMQHVHGLAVAQRLRGHPRRKEMKVLAFTAHVGDSVEQAARAAGFDGMLLKPATKAMMAQLLGDAKTADQAPSLIPDLVEAVEGDVATGMAALAQARTDDDAETARSALHGLKGVALTVAFEEAAKLAASMETGAKEGTVPTADEVRALQAAFDAALGASSPAGS